MIKKRHLKFAVSFFDRELAIFPSRVLLIGLADDSVMMYVANVVGVFAGLVQPASLSFIVQVVYVIFFFKFSFFVING